MDYCEICNAGPISIRDSLGICRPCYSGALSLISLIKNLQNNLKSCSDGGCGDGGGRGSCSGSRCVISFIKNLQNNLMSCAGGGGRGNSESESVNLPESSEVFAKCLRGINEMKDMEKEMKDKLAYLGGFAYAFKEQIHTDVQVLPGNNGSPIPTHRSLLATRSIIFKNMLDLDECLCPSNDPITLPEFSYEELESFVEFLYSGHLTEEKPEKHLYSLSVAAHKYEIPFLAKFCERKLLKSLNSDNALQALEISNTCSLPKLKEVAFKLILNNMDDIVNSARYDAFVRLNPDLSVAITKAFVDGERSIIN